MLFRIYFYLPPLIFSNYLSRTTQYMTVMMRRLSPLLITLFLSKESLQITSNSCYFPDGSPAPNDRPCFPDKASSQCCAVGHSCMSNNLCRWPDVRMPYPLVYIRGSCTDKTCEPVQMSNSSYNANQLCRE